MYRIGIISLAILSLATVSANHQIVESKPESQVRGPIIGTMYQIDFDEQAAIELKDYLDVQYYLSEMEIAKEVEDYLYAIAHPPVQTRQTSRTVNNNNAHSDAWWQGITICEQSGLNDPRYGYFSIMDGSAGGLDWSTQVAMANQIIVQYGDSAWASKCVAAGYAASPTG